MLKSDRIELALLNLIIDPPSPPRRGFQLPILEAMLTTTLGPVSSGEIIDSLLCLWHGKLVGIVKYIDRMSVPYDEGEGTEYFYRDTFHCNALPPARRRQQELSCDNRGGVFISHISEEKPIAFRLQSLLQSALPETCPVFVSSDYKSIESGEQWYNAILNELKRSQVVIVLLSPTSVDRRWINFEAGLGMGQESRVIPVVSRGLAKDQIGLPLSHLQARDLHDVEDVKALLQSIGGACHIATNDDAVTAFVAGLPPLEAGIPCTGLEVAVYRRESTFRMTIRNRGSRPLDMVDAELLIPEHLRGNNSFRNHSPVRFKASVEEDGTRWLGFRLTTIASQDSLIGIHPLPQVLAKEMGEVHVGGLTIDLPMISSEGKSASIRYRVSAKQETVGPVSVPIADIKTRG